MPDKTRHRALYFLEWYKNSLTYSDLQYYKVFITPPKIFLPQSLIRTPPFPSHFHQEKKFGFLEIQRCSDIYIVFLHFKVVGCLSVTLVPNVLNQFI